jgi:hypothetical protein
VVREGAVTDPLEARFPAAPVEGGLYESFYLKACHPSERLGVWIRYTVLKRPGSKPEGSLWFTLFEGSAPGPRASKVTLPDPTSGGDDLIRVGESGFGADRVVGSARSQECDAAWDLRVESGEEPLLHLPRPWLYRAPVPRTKLVSPHPAARLLGRLRVDGREIAVEGWPGMVGHNWGAEHAQRWIWLHGMRFEGNSDATWLDAALGRIKVGPFTTPWVGNGALSLEGVRHPLGGPGRVLRTRVREGVERCDFVLPGRDLTVHGSVRAQPKDFVGFAYADPAGGEHHPINCSIADMRLTVTHAGRAHVELRLDAGAAYELGTRERRPEVAEQPFPAG